MKKFALLFLTKEWTISDHFYDEWKMTLVLIPPWDGNFHLYLLTFFFDCFPNRDGSNMAVGARVSVQDRQTFPLMEEFGLDLAPGSLTSLALQMVKITRHEYSGCQDTDWNNSQYEEQLSEQHKADYRSPS